MNKMNKILIALLVVQAVVAVITWTAIHNEPEATEKNKLFSFSTEDITKIEITAIQGEDIQPTIVLAKTNDSWTIESADGFTAKEEPIVELLDSLTAIKVETPIATNKSTHSKLNVGKTAFDRKIVLTAKGKSVTAYVGRGARSNAMVRLANSDDVFDAQGLSVWSINSRTSTYIDTVYLKTELDAATQITVANAKESMQFVQESNEWTIAGFDPETAIAQTEPNDSPQKEVDKAEVKSFLTKLVSLTIAEPVGKQSKPEFGLADGSTSVTIQTQKDGKPVVLKYTIGEKTDNHRYVKAEENNYIVKVSNHSIEPATVKVLDDFLKDVIDESDTDAASAGPTLPQGMPPGMMMPPGAMPPGAMPPGMMPPRQ